MTASISAADTLAGLLAVAYRSNALAAVPATLEPASEADTYAVQHLFVEKCGARIGGWKIGAKSDTAPVQGAPLPQAKVYSGTTSIARRDYPVLGIELEIAFVFNCDFMPDEKPIPEAAVLNSIAAFGASIEIVSSRVAGWPEVPKLIQLADLQNHGALIVGKMSDYRRDFPFAEARLDLSIDGAPLVTGVRRNPAGDPRRLLAWLVNHCREQRLALPAATVITTGSYTGVEFPERCGTVVGEIAGLPAVTFDLV